LRLSLYVPLAGLCDELEAMARHNALEAPSFEVLPVVDDDETGFHRIYNLKVENVWSNLGDFL
jgi:hypothetical protein